MCPTPTIHRFDVLIGDPIVIVIVIIMDFHLGWVSKVQ
ncbi:hypothetical protein EVA_17878 [gut metagenome]|uniref:Uncharacterized protein n=1 Tax=gut metagenome TaxID=749906 RepID=J9FGH3_9ZZZZ